MMLRWLCLAAASLIACVSTVLQAASLDEIKARGRLSFAVYNDFAPFHSKGVGIEVDLANALAEKLGVKASFLPFEASDENIEDDLRNMVWKGHYLGYGPADVLMHVPVAASLMNSVKQVTIFSPYHSARLAVVFDKRQIPRFEALSQLGELKIGVEIASINSILIAASEDGKYRGNIRHFKNPALALSNLVEGKIAAVMATQAELEPVAKANANLAVVNAPFPASPQTNWAVGMAVKRTSDDLSKALATAMAELRESGALAAIYQKHGVGWTPDTPAQPASAQSKP
jgi:ABC-type amino acid transport substrate-binding protein